jgi:hypothetical protein
MRLNWFMATFAVLRLLAGCSPKSPDTTDVAPPGTNVVAGAKPDDLLLRVRFAGTAAMMADTNAAYLTNFASLPETTALGKRIVEKMAGLPGRLAAHKNQGLTNGSATALTPVFTDLLERGFVLELRGDGNGVRQMTLAAKVSPAEAQRWSEAYHQAAQDWFGNPTTSTNNVFFWNAGNGAMTVLITNHWVVWNLSTNNASVQPQIQRVDFTSLLKEASSRFIDQANGDPSKPVVEATLSSCLLPGPIRRGTYGGFSRLQLEATPTNGALTIQGSAKYLIDLPTPGMPPAVPADLVTERAISFTMVRNPGAWLAPDCALLRYLPNPVPNTAFFWGCESSPYQMFMAVPYPDRKQFVTSDGPTLASNLNALAVATDSGPIIFDTNRPGIQWQTVPFITPQVLLEKSGTNQFLVAQVFPATDSPPGLTPALIERASEGTNLVLLDWEFTQPRIDTWLRIGQLALMLSQSQQLGGESASLKWIRAAQSRLMNGGNTFTEVTQTGPRELSIVRRAPLAFTSTEIFWLANWLESSNFPAANFLMPVPKP